MITNKYRFNELLICYLLAFLPISLLVGVLSLLKIVPAYFNEKAYSGVTGLVISFLICLLMGLILAIFSFLLLNIGLFFYKKIFSYKNKSSESYINK
jgi:hypothetical protein